MLVELSVMEERYQAVLAVVQVGWKATEAAARLGVSRQKVDAPRLRLEWMTAGSEGRHAASGRARPERTSRGHVELRSAGALTTMAGEGGQGPWTRRIEAAGEEKRDGHQAEHRRLLG